MATQPVQRYTLEEYLAIEDTLPDRSEFHDGEIFPMEAATLVHADLCASVIGSLRSSFSPQCRVYDASLNLYIAVENKILHPDATVVCSQPNLTQRDCINNPTILVEVTSPTTKDYDHGTKREHYFTLPSLQHYLLVSQTEKRIGHYQRSADAWIYVDRGADAIIAIEGKELSVSAFYAGIL